MQKPSPVEHGVWANEKLALGATSTRESTTYSELPFFGPPAPTRWPVHRTLFTVGFLFPPLWFVGGLLPVRDSDDTWAELWQWRSQATAMMSVIVGVALLILLTAFNHPS